MNEANAKTGKLTVLGCGNSAGVPAIGDFWGNCDPEEPKNRRFRASIAVQDHSENTVIVDTGPDFRLQVNQAGLDIFRIEAVLYTHAHSDHVSGLDELRVIRNRTKKIIPVYSDKVTMDWLQDRFDYSFKNSANGLYPKVLEPYVIEDKAIACEPFNVEGVDCPVMAFAQDHGSMISLGFRFGDVAYSTDMVGLPEESLAALSGVKTWIIDGAGYKNPENPVHANLKQVYRLNDIVGAQRVIITHLSPFMDYQTLCRELSEGFEPAYDGLEISFSY